VLAHSRPTDRKEKESTQRVTKIDANIKCLSLAIAKDIAEKKKKETLLFRSTFFPIFQKNRRKKEKISSRQRKRGRYTKSTLQHNW
jgi:hypothetical protein